MASMRYHGMHPAAATTQWVSLTSWWAVDALTHRPAEDRKGIKEALVDMTKAARAASSS